MEHILLSDGDYNSFELNMIIRFYFEDIHDEYSKYIVYALKFSNQIKNKKFEDALVEMQDYYDKYRVVANLLVLESKKL